MLPQSGLQFPQKRVYLLRAFLRQLLDAAHRQVQQFLTILDLTDEGALASAFLPELFCKRHNTFFEPNIFHLSRQVLNLEIEILSHCFKSNPILPNSARSSA